MPVSEEGVPRDPHAHPWRGRSHLHPSFPGPPLWHFPGRWLRFPSVCAALATVTRLPPLRDGSGPAGNSPPVPVPLEPPVPVPVSLPVPVSVPVPEKAGRAPWPGRSPRCSQPGGGHCPWRGSSPKDTPKVAPARAHHPAGSCRGAPAASAAIPGSLRGSGGCSGGPCATPGFGLSAARETLLGKKGVPGARGGFPGAHGAAARCPRWVSF